MKVLAVYPGRFQPFHKGHAQVYQWLKNKFGDAVIATSDKVEAPKSPFNFKEKKKMMTLAGVPANSVKQVTNPYIAREILQDYDPKKTVLVFAVSQKDMEEDPRFSFKPLKSGKPGYLQPYKGNEKNLKPFGDVQAPKGYVIVTPTFTFNVLGQPATSASELRKQFVSLDNNKQKEFIKDLFGKYDASVHKLMDTKIKSMIGKPKTMRQLREHLNIGLTFARKEMPQLGASKSFVEYMRRNGIESARRELDPSKLRSSQMEFDRDKIEGLKEKPSKNPIVVSNDGHVIDGHHRWAADCETGRNSDAYVVDLPVLDLLHRAKHYTKMELNEEITRKDFIPMLNDFISFAAKELDLQDIPDYHEKSINDKYLSFAAYSPDKRTFSVAMLNRHPMDIFRSVAHEMVHHKQNEEGRVEDAAEQGKTGSPIENEANEVAGIIMRKYGKKNPDFFQLTHIVENNFAGDGSIRGLGYVTGSSDGTPSNYLKFNISMADARTDNIFQHYKSHEKMHHRQNIDKKHLRDIRKKAALKRDGVINEGVNDPGKLKAIFLAGGPGSGKDFVMNSALTGEGLREVNSDIAFEYLMKKHGLDMEMPDEEKIERDIVRGHAKNITKEQQRLALSGRLGVIINGTADDLEKIKTIKKNLEADGYETMMVFVNTSNEVSRQRNVDRGKGGGRKVPDGTDKQGNPNGSEDIRTEKWELAQKNIGELQKVFGNQNFVVIDNSVDIRKATSEVKNKVLTDFNRVRRMAQQFVRSENQNPAAKEWIKRETEKRGITQYQEPKRYKTLTQIRQSVPDVVHKPDNELMAQARRLGLSYYGFGRFGRRVNGVNKVLYQSKGGQLVKTGTINEDLRKWFREKWVRFDTKGNIKGPCAREPGEGKPKCRPLASARAMDKEERAKSARRKRREDPVANRPGKGGKPINVKTEAFNADRMSEQVLAEKNKPTNPELWARAKSLARSKFDVYPSAYANGWASKWYKSKGGGWKSVDEEFTSFMEENKPSDREWGTSSLTKIYKKDTPGQDSQASAMSLTEKSKKKKLKKEDAPPPYGYEFGNSGMGPTFSVPRSPGGVGLGYSLPLSESIWIWANSPQTQDKFIQKYGELAEQKVIETAIKLQEAGLGCKCKMEECSCGKPKSVKKIREFNSEPEPMGMVATQRKQDRVDEGDTWHHAKYQNPKGGLTKAGVMKYRQEHPGSKLQTAVRTPPSKLKKGSKSAKRRLSFCRRMKGMKAKLTSAKTARDPNSRINKSLRAWNCEE